MKPVASGAFDAISTLPALRHVEVWDYPWESLTPFIELKNLTCLGLGMGRFDLEPVSQLTKLEALTLYSCQGFDSLAPLSCLQHLQQLKLHSCASFASLRPIHQLTTLRQLTLVNCSRLTSLDPISRLTGLQCVGITGCAQVASFKPIRQLTMLEMLALGYHKLNSLRHVSHLTTLLRLDLTGLSELTSLEDISQLTGLQQLSLVDLPGLTSLMHISQLMSLQHLNCNSNVNLSGQDAVGLFESLEVRLASLAIHRCELLKTELSRQDRDLWDCLSRMPQVNPGHAWHSRPASALSEAARPSLKPEMQCGGSPDCPVVKDALGERSSFCKAPDSCQLA